VEIRHLRTFVAIAETMSFTKASEQLDLSQSALTQQLQALESELGVTLIDRTNRRRMSLSGPGEVLLESGKRLLAEEQEVRGQVQSAMEGVSTLSIGHMGSATSSFIGTWVREFLSQHPDCRISFFDLAPSEQERRIERREIDLGFVREPNPKRDLRVQILPVYEDRLVLAVPEQHLDYESASIHDLRNHPLILYNRTQAPWLNQSVEGYLFNQRIVPGAVRNVDGMVPLLLTIASGQGYSLVPLCLKNLGVPGVEFRELHPPAPPLAVSLVWLRENRSPLLTAFVEFVSSRSAHD
jgi:DNA-binding transcriptional LysR family regulator